jgi:transcription elongation factor Elf1
MALDYYEDEDEKDSRSGKARRDFDCPDCNANNPLEEPLADGMEVLCNYCGCEYQVKALESGRFKFRAM